MDFGLSCEISDSVLQHASIITELSNIIEDFFKDKNYGDGIQSLTIGIICVEPEAEAFYEIRKKYTKTKKRLEYDIKIELKSLKAANKKEAQNIIMSNILASIKIIELLSIQNFDTESFRNDIRKFCKNIAP